MKSFVFICTALLTLSSCNNPITEKIKETKQQVSNTQEAFKEITDLQENIEELQEVVPLTNEELKAWLPDEVNGMKRTGYKAGQGAFMKIAMIEGTFTSEDKSKKFKVEIMDGAGTVGASATAGMRILFSQDFEEEDENKYRKTMTKDGVKAIVEYRKKSNNSEIQVFVNDRFFINAKGTNMNVDETWDAIMELDAEDLG